MGDLPVQELATTPPLQCTTHTFQIKQGGEADEVLLVIYNYVKKGTVQTVPYLNSLCNTQ